jgi:heavy metal efflux system protein
MNAAIAFALRQRALMVLLLLFMFGVGIASFVQLNIEAYPDPVPPLVDVVTQNPGQSAEEIERYITIPIEIQMAGIPNVTAVRTISLFGLSDVKVQFTYAFTYDEAQQWVINRLSQLSPLPNGATPQISPDSPTGEIYRYRVMGPPGFSVTDLKTIQNWILERRFKAVPGVIDVTGWGGKTKTYEITVDLDRLLAQGITLPQVLQTLNNSNINVGGQTVNFGPQAAIVRGVGLIHSMDQIRDTMITAVNGVPVRIGDVAMVTAGHQPRLGIAGQDDDDDIVQGIVLMRRGEQSMPTIRRVEAEVAKINGSDILPPGVRIERIYDRSDLNLLSVGAIDFGLVVDATVIMVENIFRHLAEPPTPLRQRTLQSARRATRLSGRLIEIYASANEVNQAIFFSAAIIVAGFVPLFTMSGVEGHIFAPMAKTYAYAIAGGLIATFTITPALSAILLPERISEIETSLMRGLRRLHRPVLEFALANRIVTLGGAASLLALAVVALPSLGLEFLPKLEEGNLWIRATLPPSISLEEANGYVNRMRRIIKSFPEAVTVISQNGRPDDGTDATGFFNAEFFVPLEPFETWPSGVDKEKLTQQVSAALKAQFPGVEFNFSQYIEDNVEEAASGVKGENSVKLFGNDLGALEKTAARIKEVMSTAPGIADLAVLNSLGQPTVQIDIDRARAARYGLAPGDINSTITAAIGGQAAGNLYEEGSDRNFPMVVRLAPNYRQSLDAIRRITIGAPNPSGSGIVPIPLTDVATVRLVSGASFIYRENQERYIPIKFSVRGRDLGSAVLEAQQKIAQQIELPAGYRLEWVGEFGELQEAIGRLAVAVPLSLALICVLLFLNFGAFRDMTLAASAMPMALIGGIFALFLTGTPFSVSAAIGFVALFGISAMDGIIVIGYFNRQIEAGVERGAALLRTCTVQMRPVAMTCIVACVGLLPAALSSGIGSQVQKPLAIVVVGGSLLAPFLILLVLPVLIDLFSRRRQPVEEAEPRPAPAE